MLYFGALAALGALFGLQVEKTTNAFFRPKAALSAGMPPFPDLSALIKHSPPLAASVAALAGPYVSGLNPKSPLAAGSGMLAAAALSSYYPGKLDKCARCSHSRGNHKRPQGCCVYNCYCSHFAP